MSRNTRSKTHQKAKFIKQNEQVFHIPQPYKSKFDKGVKKVLQDLNLVQQTDKVPFWGNKPASDNYKKMMKKYVRCLTYFCAIIRDYESSIILQERPNSFEQEVMFLWLRLFLCTIHVIIKGVNIY